MRIKAFENFSFGKMGNKNKKNDSSAGDERPAEASDIVEIETEKNGKVKGIKAAAVKTKKPAEDAELMLPLDVPPVKPHGPAAELTIDGEISDEPVILGDDVNAAETAVKVVKAGTLNVKVEVSAPAAGASLPVAGATLPVAGAAPPAEEKKENKSDDSMSLNNLFSQEEEEENPLDSLIKSLPDVSVQELMDDLAEIHRIIKEWRPETKSMI
jgi:hypothetical protein